MGNSSFLLLILVVWIINFLISFWNARVVGLVWVETKYIGGWMRFMTWMGAIMSACGFTWCYLILVVFGAYSFHVKYFTAEIAMGTLSLGYLIIIPFVLFAGFFIWIQSLVEAWRRKDLPSVGIAAWNTFAQVHNTYSAMKGLPDAWKSVKGIFKKNEVKGKGAIILVVIVVLISGVLTTMSIVKKYAGTVPLPERQV